MNEQREDIYEQPVVKAVLRQLNAAGIDDERDWARKLARKLRRRMVSELCPRCWEPRIRSNFDSNQPRAAGTKDLGEALTVCPTCFEDEQNQAILGNGYTPMWAWPVSVTDMRARAQHVYRMRHKKSTRASLVSLVMSDWA